MKKKILIAVLSMFLSSSLTAKADMKFVDEYLKVSGAKEIILMLPGQIEKGYFKNSKKKTGLKKSFNPKEAIKYVKIKLSHEFTNSLLKKIISYYESPIGKKFKNSSISMRENDDKQKKIFFKKLKKTPLTFERANVVNAFVNQLELTPVAVHLIGELLGSIDAKLASEPNSEQVLSSISEQIKDTMFENALYAYRNFSNDELKSVMDFSYTNAGRFEQLIVSGVFKQLIQESFAQIIEQNRPQLATN